MSADSQRRPYKTDDSSELDDHTSQRVKQNSDTVDKSEGDSDDTDLYTTGKSYSTYPDSDDDQEKHVYIHTGEKPLPVHTSVKDLLKINSDSKSVLKLFECQVCEKVFSKAFVYHRHMRTHSEDRPHCCTFCEMKFKEKSHLKTHLNQHTGNRPYSCELCKLCFLNSAALHRHKLKHTGAKPFSCIACDKLFSRKDAFKIHMTNHAGVKPFACHVCDKRFVRSNDLTRHLKIHTGEKPFICHICQKAFIRSSGLDRHLKIHTGEKSFICCFCDQKFARKDAMKSHERKHANSIISDKNNHSASSMQVIATNPICELDTHNWSLKQQCNKIEKEIKNEEQTDLNDCLSASTIGQCPVSHDISPREQKFDSLDYHEDPASTDQLMADEEAAMESPVGHEIHVASNDYQSEEGMETPGQSRKSILKQFWTLSKLQASSKCDLNNFSTTP